MMWQDNIPYLGGVFSNIHSLSNFLMPKVPTLKQVEVTEE